MEKLTRPNAEIHIRHLTGRNPGNGEFAPSLVAQLRLALAQGASELEQHGYSLRDVTRIIFTLSGTEGFSACFSTLNELFGQSCPATTLRLVKSGRHQDELVELDLLVTPKS